MKRKILCISAILATLATLQDSRAMDPDDIPKKSWWRKSPSNEERLEFSKRMHTVQEKLLDQFFGKRETEGYIGWSSFKVTDTGLGGEQIITEEGRYIGMKTVGKRLFQFGVPVCTTALLWMCGVDPKPYILSLLGYNNTTPSL